MKKVGVNMTIHIVQRTFDQSMVRLGDAQCSSSYSCRPLVVWPSMLLARVVDKD